MVILVEVIEGEIIMKHKKKSLIVESDRFVVVRYTIDGKIQYLSEGGWYTFRIEAAKRFITLKNALFLGGNNIVRKLKITYEVESLDE